MPSATRADKYNAFRALHERPGLFIIPNPWDAGTSRILTSLGFEALATTSAGYAFSIGYPDSNQVINRVGLLANAKEIVDATHLPVSADMQDGFGQSPEHCAETVRLAAGVGLAGGSIEDATGDPNSPIYEFKLAVAKIEAAAEAAKETGFILTARAENYLHGNPDLNDTIKRLQAFEEAGADVLYAPGLPSVEAVRQVCASLSKPVNVLMGLAKTPFTLEEIEAAGAKRVSIGSSFARAALGGFIRAALEVKEKGTFTYTTEAISSAEAAQYMGF